MNTSIVQNNGIEATNLFTIVIVLRSRCLPSSTHFMMYGSKLSKGVSVVPKFHC